MSDKVLLEMNGITKVFPGVKALDNVSFRVQEHHIHALVGENGAGKSTLMNVLQPYIDSGVIVIPSGQTELGQCATEGWDPLKAQARMDNLISANYADGTVLNGVLSPYDGLSIGIISSLKSVGYGTADLPLPIVSGQDCEIPSIKSIIAGEQYATIFNNTTTLAGVAVDMTLQALAGEEVTVNSTYDNGVFEVPSMSIPATIITAENYEAELVDSGYIAAEDLL